MVCIAPVLGPSSPPHALCGDLYHTRRCAAATSAGCSKGLSQCICFWFEGASYERCSAVLCYAVLCLCLCRQRGYGSTAALASMTPWERSPHDAARLYSMLWEWRCSVRGR